MNFGQAFSRLLTEDVCLRRFSWKDAVVLGLDAEAGLVWGDSTLGKLILEPVSVLPAVDLLAGDWEAVPC